MTFNKFTNTIQQTFENNFPLKRTVLNKDKRKSWITKGILVSSKNLKQIYIQTINNNDPNIKNYYKNIKRCMIK